LNNIKEKLSKIKQLEKNDNKDDFLDSFDDLLNKI